jgi:16S rRNA (uracil1498-N3)-methyltransferase
MSVTRVYVETTLKVSSSCVLNSNASHHLLRVLRMTVGDTVKLFHDDGFEYVAEIVSTARNQAEVAIHRRIQPDSEAHFKIHLAQGLSRGQKMDYVIQKSVECGVASITPILSERCGVKINASRMQNKLNHWQSVAISACEQSGRSVVPTIHPPRPLSDYLSTVTGETLIAHPGVHSDLSSIEHVDSVNVLIGPEGGFSDAEYAQAMDNNCQPLFLGPRVLRTETAPVVALSLLQYRFGDLKL